MIKVWDPALRLFHWLLVAAVATSAWTGFFGPRNALGIHLAAGATIAALILFRAVWGVTGPTYARFASFAFGPSSTLAYTAAFLRDPRARYLGHNPLGAAMIVALMATLILIAATGVLTLGGVDKQGPAAFATSYALGREGFALHRALAYGLMGLIVGHLAGVALETIRGDRGLIAAMISGRKTAGADDRAAPAVTARPLLAALLFGSLAAGASVAIAALAARPALGVPVAALPPLYLKECGGCHMAYPPSLGVAARWTAVMASLGDHFGEDASLDAKAQSEILAYLVSHSAETADTRAAHALGPVNPADPLHITATRAWRRFHRSISDAAFATKRLRSKSACDACHRDAASGRFDPQAISVPEPSPS